MRDDAAGPDGSALSEGLGPGTWLALDFGFEREVFYVVQATKEGAYLGHPKWLVSSATFMPWSRLKGADIIGRGRPRWWWRFVPWRDLHVPFSRPSSLFWV